jgi:small GTP-binding protein
MINLCIWDTAGQEQFEALMPLYTRESSLVVITAAINDDLSFQSIPKWLDAVASSGRQIPPCILAVNKMDLVAQAAWTKEQIYDTYETSFASIFFICALNGENCTELLTAAANEAAQFMETVKRLDTPGQPAIRMKQNCC